MQINYNIGDNELRLELCKIIIAKIEEKGWTKTKTADILGLDQPQVSQLERQTMNREIHGFSLKRLLGFLENIGYEVKITIEDKKDKE